MLFDPSAHILDLEKTARDRVLNFKFRSYACSCGCDDAKIVSKFEYKEGV